ncbi:Protein spt10 [Clarireedia jacksonii]
MPAMLDDPSAPTIYRTSGAAPFPDPHDPNPALPLDVFPRQVTLRDRVTTATIVPFSSRHQVPASLLAYLSDQFNKELDTGDTYPIMDTMTHEKFASYWFQNFGAIMLIGNIESASDVVEGRNWATECLGSYYIKPNYPGRSSHICNAGFLVTDAARNKGAGRLMGESYLEWAPRLGYTYSVFNLVYETNVASCRIWDALGFKRIGRVKGAGNLKSYPGKFIDAIIYGRDLGPEGSDFVSEERFDKIKFYLKYKEYPSGADRAEKSRLRSAATHYKLLPDEDKLMLKGKEVISDPHKQYEIARGIHVMQHGGINKTTAMIAEKYHWVRIKETVSIVIKNCIECKELGKTPAVRAADATQIQQHPQQSFPGPIVQPRNSSVSPSAAGRILSMPTQHQNHQHDQSQHPSHQQQTPLQHSYHQQQPSHSQNQLQHDFHHQLHHHHHPHHSTSVSPQVLNRRLPSPSSTPTSVPVPVHIPVPISSYHQQQPQHHSHSHSHIQHHSHTPSHTQTQRAHEDEVIGDVEHDYLPLDPQIMDYKYTSSGNSNQESGFDGGSFQEMLGDGVGFRVGVGTRDTDAVDGEGISVGVGVGVGNDDENADLDSMLIDQDDEDEEEEQTGGNDQSDHLEGDVSGKIITMATAKAAHELIAMVAVEVGTGLKRDGLGEEVEDTPHL